MISRRLLGISIAVSLVFCLSLFSFAADGSGVFSILSDFYQALKNMFVPRPDYFDDQLHSLNNLINSRFGGLAHIYLMLDEFFRGLNSPSAAPLVFSLPNNFFFNGYRGFSYDVFSAARPYLSFLKAATNGAVCIFTATCCYHKLRTFFTEEG